MQEVCEALIALVVIGIFLWYDGKQRVKHCRVVARMRKGHMWRRRAIKGLNGGGYAGGGRVFPGKPVGKETGSLR